MKFLPFYCRCLSLRFRRCVLVGVFRLASRCQPCVVVSGGSVNVRPASSMSVVSLAVGGEDVGGVLVERAGSGCCVVESKMLVAEYVDVLSKDMEFLAKSLAAKMLTGQSVAVRAVRLVVVCCASASDKCGHIATSGGRGSCSGEDNVGWWRSRATKRCWWPVEAVGAENAVFGTAAAGGAVTAEVVAVKLAINWKA